jgi:hypothetical protein
MVKRVAGFYNKYTEVHYVYFGDFVICFRNTGESGFKIKSIFMDHMNVHLSSRFYEQLCENVAISPSQDIQVGHSTIAAEAIKRNVQIRNY